jgi:hypothetical protein
MNIMSLPDPKSVPVMTVMYYGGNINYTDGTQWIPILTAGSFTQIEANGFVQPLTLGTWAGTVTDHEALLQIMQNDIQTLTTQVSLMQATLNELTSTKSSNLTMAMANNIAAYVKFLTGK